MDIQLKALVVEDVATEVELTVRELQQSGIHLDIHVVQDEPGLREALTEFAPDIVLSDFTLPQFDGMRALRIVREVSPDIPFIFVSGTIGEERAIEALKQGASDYVLKSNLKRLPQAVRQAQERRRLQIERREAELLRTESERKLRNIVDTIKEWIWEADKNGKISFSSDYVASLLGHEAKAITTKSVLNHIHPEDRASFLSDLVLWNGEAPSSGVVHRWLHRDGSTIWVESNASPLQDAQSNLVGYRVASRDITEHKLRENVLARISRAHELSSKTNAAIVRIRDRDALLQEICRIAVEAGNYEMARISLLGEDQETLRVVAWAGIAAGPFNSLDLSVREDIGAGKGITGQAMREGAVVICNDIEKDPRPVYLRDQLLDHGFHALVAMPFIVKGKVVGVLNLFAVQAGVFHEDEMEVLRDLVSDICYALEHLENEEKLNYLALYDSLTGLANRALFSERLAQILNMPLAVHESIVIVLWDIENLTDINNTFGRHVGDKLLQQIAERLRNGIGGERAIAHFGGGKFATFMMRHEAANDPVKLVNERETALLRHTYRVDGNDLHVSVRSGITLFPQDADNSDSLIWNAEAALNNAKSLREHTVVYSSQLATRAGERLSLEARLHRALLEEEFLLHYQPKVRVADGKIFGVEALIRWQDPEFGLIPPIKFIPVLEHSGMIVEVDRWVIRQALKDQQSWREAGLAPIHVAVNISSIELRRDDFVSWLLDTAGADQRGASGIDVEITESMLMQDIDVSIRKLEALREAGVSIAIDDFGTGYSSLSYLAKLPVDILKIDRSFVKGIVSDSDDLQIISTIVSLARALDLITIAEGVETLEQYQLLKQMKCSVIQGYFFSKPVPDAELRKLLAQGSFPLPRK